MDEDCEERLDADNSLFKSLHYHDSLLQDSMGFWKNKKIQPINNASNKHTDFHEKYKINLENPDLFLEKDIDIETESEVGNLDLFKRLSLKRDSDVESNNSTHSEYLESLSNFDLSNEERSDTNSGEHMHKYIWSMELEERRVLYDSWVKQVSEACNKSLIDLKLALKNKINEYKELESINMSEMIAEASVVGITTTRASKYIDALKAWKPTVILCEEAGEVLEAHVIASLSKSTKQLILIGDHKQLRPRIQEFNLSVESRSGKQYRLDVSLFERLMDPKCHLPLYTLQEQRRMKPIISQFIRQTVYSELSDGKDVLNRNPIRGMQKDVFFMTHSHPQSSNEELFGGLGHSNRFEVEMIVETVKYLFKQGYTCEQMVILTPYLFQARMLRRAMSTVEPPPKSHAPSNIVRVETVDNFQGEEADIILISLVRSTFDSGSDYGIGFLKIENRITVLLSRARNGMYIFGNAPLLEQHSKMWKTIINLMKEQNLIDIKLPIICANHPEDVRYIENPKDFLKVSPSGGCLKLCNFRLKCGHSCPEPCHIEDQEHTKYKCKKPCNHHFPDCGHRCSKLCYEICDKCKIILQDVQLPKCGHMLKSPQCHVLLDLSKVVCEEIVTHQRDCGHILKFKCFKDPKSFLMSECKKQVAYARPCGHTFLLLCHQNTESYISANPCNSIMGPVLLPNCGHILKKPKCHELEDLNNVKCEQQVSSKRFCQHTINLKCYENVDTIRCSENCGKLLKCGHPCHNLCYKCIGKPDEAYKHSLCTSTCDKLLPCFHKCKEKCHINECSLKCKEQCLKSKCKHKNCSNLCNYPCEPCLGKCDWSCVHQGNCPYPCGYPCLRLPCDKNCAKKLKCGHPCPSVCGEICPSSKYCLKCSKANNTLNAQEYELLQNHACNLNEDPLMFLKCGHFFPISELDSKFSLQSYYEKSDGKWLKPIYPQKWVQSYLSCPKCSFPVCRIDANRYARIINMTILMDSSTLEITKVSNNFNIAASFIRRFDANVQLSDLTRIQELDQKFLTFSEKFFNSASNQMALKILRSINLELFLGMKPFYLLYNSPQYICVHANYYILKARMTMLLLKTQIKKFSSISDFQQLNEYHKEASFYYTQAIQCYIQSNANISILELELENAYNFIYHKIKFLVFAVFGEFRTLNPHTQREDIQWELHLIDNFLRHLHRVQAHDGKYKRVSYTSYFHDYTWTLKTIGGLLSEKWQILANPNKMHLYVHKSSVASFLNSCHRIKRFSFHFKDEEVDFSSKDINIPWHICSEGHFYVKTLKNSKKNAKCLECGGELLKKLD
ncbi:hypothetical protein HMI55_000618 [Coelomomyces lativittatus]|nr:hypothetical protein HMI55_000618 [Coelomomyces lativittatus]